MSDPLPAPQTLPEFSRAFHSEEACVDYLFALRWPDGFKCYKCGDERGYRMHVRRAVECGNHHLNYLTAGTLMEHGKQPLLTWFYGAFLLSTLTPGMSAVQFQKQMGIKTYETAFQMLHKLRSAMVNPDREPLHGRIEMDETFVGGATPGQKGGRSTEEKTLVVGAVERIAYREKGKDKLRAARVRMRAIADASSKTLLGFAADHLKTGSTVLTDGWHGYDRFKAAGYDHRVTVQRTAKESESVLPLLHLEFSNLKTWLQGTHHARQERQHLQAYLNEFCFRHNRRFWRFNAFQTILRLAIKHGAQTYDDLYQTDDFGRSVHPNPAEEGLDA